MANKEVLLAQNQAGFVSCSISGKMAQIGLIAVDKNQRGKGLGKKLVRAAEDFALQSGAQTMTIGTQQANVPASRLYQSLGYELVERMYVYHYRP
nr:GNAT family N-acetyltransferase [Algoriphagus sp. AK58]